MTDERCERTELLVDQCAHCLGHQDPAADALAAGSPRHYAVDIETPRTTIARYPGRCAFCGEQIDPGDLITAVAAPGQSRQTWACAGCEP
ncbi:hypothetical protein VA596_41495 [Amycolatopsis sp., V23-08]|uniref:Uncharacterized protein n=1 Tax=Amycolatopsis heterodermiae TaxID=3110235 RepID=A0ABU5RID8_9PSEU|nr:hypothetical protein [Amycolatopsis sp., V23-08]MEA5366061.1 hypothetical protein [Amycolatopsis sp., V23-08]